MKFIGTREEIGRIFCRFARDDDFCDGYTFLDEHNKRIPMDTIKCLSFDDGFVMEFIYIEESGVQDEIEQEIDSLL